MSSPYRGTNISTPGDATPRGVVGEDIFSPRCMMYLGHMLWGGEGTALSKYIVPSYLSVDREALPLNVKMEGNQK
jgi:hypothetical protein